MGHFKRGRPKSRRAGCLLCKPHKAQWLKDSWRSWTRQEFRAIESEHAQRSELLEPDEPEADGLDD
jgi:hypothetical protein